MGGQRHAGHTCVSTNHAGPAHLPLLAGNSDTVHWGYFSKLLKPRLEVNSGDYVTIEAVTHHAGDDVERIVKGDPGVESIYLWTKDKGRQSARRRTDGRQARSR